MDYERAFNDWLAARGGHCNAARYSRTVGGETTAFLLEPASPPRALVVFAHGAGNDAWFPQLSLFRVLLENGYAVWTFDLDGHGRRSTTHLDPEAVAGAVPDALAHARATLPGLPVHLLGQSFGGALALGALARGTASDVASAAFLSAPLHVRPNVRMVLSEIAGFCSHTCLAQRRNYGIWGLVPAFGPFKRATFPIRLARAAGRSWDYVAVVNESIKQLGLPEVARDVQVPVLLVYGERDGIVPLDQGETLRDHLPRAELRILPRDTHYTVALSPETEQAVLAWFQQHT